MSNPYSSNQSWDLFGQQGFKPNSNPYTDANQSNAQQPTPFNSYQSAYTYQQQQQSQPPSSTGTPVIPSTSSLQGALQSSQSASHSRTSSYASNGSSSAFPTHHVQGSGSGSAVYGGGRVTNPAVTNASYRGSSFRFGASNPPSLSLPSGSVANGVSLGSAGLGFMTDSPTRSDSLPTRLDQSLPLPYNFNTGQASEGPSTTQSNKRQRPNTSADDTKDDSDSKLDGDSKDPNKAKPARACARCKNLKVRCEAKTENEPCKRCLNGGHECFIPGRKIRRVPPKREHLINQIQAQAKAIEGLMKQLEAVTGTKPNIDGFDSRGTTPSSPVLSPSTTDSFLESTDGAPPPITSPTGTGQVLRSAPATTKAIEDWIAKTRENMLELNYIVVGNAGAPESYLRGERPEDGSSSSSDDDFVDVKEELDEEDHEQYQVEVHDPEGGLYTGETRSIRHKLSASSVGTTKSAGTQATNTTNATHANRKKSDDKPGDLPVEASPFGLFGKMSLATGRRSAAGSEAGDDDDKEKSAGIASENFFKASDSFVRQMRSIQHQAPAILTKGLITPAEAETLFGIYYAEMNLSVSLLDPVLYDAKRTFWRSPFLFTVICGIASRFYEERPELYMQAMHYAQLAAGTALISGTKNVEMCAAYILLSLYPVPAKKWEQQRSWLYLGLAIRVATDLNLHLPMTAKPRNENHAREMLNRTRIWLNCFNVDRSTGSQYGKPPTISSLDYCANHSEEWWNSSPYNMKHFDIHISAYNAELRLMSNFMGKLYNNPEHPTGLNKDADFEALATQADDELQRLKAKWFAILDKTDNTDPQNCFRTGLLRLAYSYARLIALSYGFQNAFGKNDGQDENPFLMRCLAAATDVVHAVVKEVPRTLRHYFRHGPEAQSVFVTFASAFLVKLLQPKFASYLTMEQRVEIRNLVQQVIDLLAEISLDDRHGPKLYSRFLKGLLASPLAKLDPSAPDAPPSTTASPTSRARSRSRKPAARSQHSHSTSVQASLDAGIAASMMQLDPSTSALHQYTQAAANNYNFDFAQSFGAGQIFNAPSPVASSPSPPPAESVSSFDHFRPAGGIDPYAPDDAAAYVMHGGPTGLGAVASGGVGVQGMRDGQGGGQNMNVDAFMSDYFQPELPFDEEIVRSIQDLSNPSGWQDISIPPGFNWMTQFQQNVGMDLASASNAMGIARQPSNNLNNQAPLNLGMYDAGMNYMTGPNR